MEDSALQKGTSRSKFLFFFIVGIIVIVGAFGAWQFFGAKSEEEEIPSPTPTEFQFPTEEPTLEVTEEIEPTEVQSPTLTPKPTIDSVDKQSGLDRSELSVEVQNGSGVAGAAAKASDALKTFGYNVVTVGNADNFDYADVTIQVKSAKSDYLSLLKKDLGANYTIGTTSAALTADFSADALVIVGK